MRLMAFLGRYAHQDMRTMMSMTVRDLGDLAAAITQLLEDERAQLPLPE